MRIFFRPEQSVQANVFSPSPGKPEHIVERWKRLPSVEIVSFEPLTREDLALAHSRDYVDSVLDLRAANGFGTKDAAIAATLPYTSGSFYAAASYAVTNGENAVSPTSGFHHAGYDYGRAFCTFNGLMVAARKLRQEFPAIKVGILDLDAHYGDGTHDIIRNLGFDNIIHYTFGAHRIGESNAQEWLDSLSEILADFASCHVVFYQAGADPHVDDPLGGVLTTAQMFERDRIVFQTLREAGVPVAWNLAGGYQQPIDKVLDLHDNTMRACLGV